MNAAHASAVEDSPTTHRTVPVRDSLGCSLSALGCHQELIGSGFAIYRKSHAEDGIHRVETPASDRGLLVGVALTRGHRRRIFDGNRSVTHDFEEDSCYVRSFSDGYRADVETGFDFFLLEIRRSALQRTFAETGLSCAEGLTTTPGARDPVLAHLARALLPALANAKGSSPLFLDQMASAIQTHLATRLHGGVPKAGRARGLSGAQVARAKEMLAAGLAGQVLIGDIASACEVSRGHFIRGFKEATGATPYQWLLMQRIEQARDLLVNSRLPLADVAVVCGFSDQSHMTRTFTRLTGAAPGAWRRRR